MRSKINHTQPANTQPMPADNTSPYVATQVAIWLGLIENARWNGAVIHAQSAMEIAAWWQGPSRQLMPFTQFAQDGTITRGLMPAIDLHIESAGQSADGEGCVNELRALRAYIEAVPVTSGYTPCACRDCMDTAVSNDITIPDLCNACEDAGCDVDGESGCEREDAYEMCAYPGDHEHDHETCNDVIAEMTGEEN